MLWLWRELWLINLRIPLVIVVCLFKGTVGILITEERLSMRMI